MRTRTIIKRLEASKTRKRTVVYELLTEFCQSYDRGFYNVIHTVKGNGYNYGRYYSITDKTRELTDLLDKLKIKYERGNDAPRGGRLGTYVRILNMRRK